MVADWYNMTALDATNALTLVQSVNTEYTLSFLGTVIIVILFFVSYISFSYYVNDKTSFTNNRGILFSLSATFLFVTIIGMAFYWLSLVKAIVPIVTSISTGIFTMLLAFVK